MVGTIGLTVHHHQNLQVLKEQVRDQWGAFFKNRLRLAILDGQESRFSLKEPPAGAFQLEGHAEILNHLGLDLCPLFSDLTSVAFSLKEKKFVKYMNYKDFEYPAWGKVVASKGSFSFSDGRIFLIPSDLKTYESFPLEWVEHQGKSLLTLSYYGVPMHQNFCRKSEVDQSKVDLINL